MEEGNSGTGAGTAGWRLDSFDATVLVLNALASRAIAPLRPPALRVEKVEVEALWNARVWLPRQEVPLFAASASSCCLRPCLTLSFEPNSVSGVNRKPDPSNFLISWRFSLCNHSLPLTNSRYVSLSDCSWP